MGLTKQYLRYVAGGSFNCVCSQRCNVAHVTLQGCSGRYVAAAACEHVVVWDARLSEKAQVLVGERSEVTRLRAAKSHIAVGYADGNVQIFDLKTSEPDCALAGHKSAVTALAFDDAGHRLFSGSQDTDVISWDLVAQVGFARLSGHKGAVTDVGFVEARSCVVSCSKDGFVKFWDLETKHCFKTLSGHRSEVWALALMKNGRYLVTGCSEQALKVWRLKWTDEKDGIVERTKALQIAELDDSEEAEENSPLQCQLMGKLLRSGRGRVVSLQTDANASVLACFGTDSTLELVYFNEEEEAQARLRKRLKKSKKETDQEMKEEDDGSHKDLDVLTLSDEVRRLSSIKLGSKIKGVDIVMGAGSELRIAVSLANNTLELHSLNVKVKDAPVTCLRQINGHGHQSEVRCVAFSSDNLAIASASSDSIKLWNRPSQMCLRTVTSDPVVSLCFAPGDRHLLAGLQDGRLLIVDISSGDILEDIPAHESEVWSVTLLPDLSGAVTASGDKTVKIWKFELVPDPTEKTRARVLSLIHKRTLQLEEGVLCAKVSPNAKFVAVGLLDSTVKIFYLDTFKFALSLYGHKLPVLCLDISYDSALIATGSADRNIKIWGMDFGDCHKSIFAHDDSVTSLQFVAKTHYIFTCGRDGKVKQWDGDTFDKINTLQGHVGEARCLSVAPSGLWAVTCGADRVIRIWERTEEPLVLGDVDEAQEEELITGDKAESILECLDVCHEYNGKKTESRGGTFQLPILMQAFQCQTPEDYLLKTVQRIRASDLEESLLILPFKSVCEILQMLPKLLDRRDNVELICKLSLFLIKVHHAAIVASHDLLNDLANIQKLIVARMTELRDTVGYNMHALLWQQREFEVAEKETLFKDLTKERKKKNKKRKARETLKRSMIVLT